MINEAEEKRGRIQINERQRTTTRKTESRKTEINITKDRTNIKQEGQIKGKQRRKMMKMTRKTRRKRQQKETRSLKEYKETARRRGAAKRQHQRQFWESFYLRISAR